MFLLVAGHPPWALPSPFVPGSRVLSVQCSRLPQLGLSLPQRIPCPLEDGEFVPPLVPDPSQIFKIKNPQVYSRPDPELPPSSQAQKLCSVEDPSKDCAAPLQEDVSAADLGANRNLSMKILHPQSKIVQIRRHYSTILKSDIQPHAARRLSVAERLNPPVWGRWATQPPSRSLVPRRDADVTTQGLNSRSSTTQVKEDQWSEVKPRFWWRKQQSFNPPNNQKPMHSRKQLFLKHVGAGRSSGSSCPYFCMVASTGETERLRELFTARSVVAWVEEGERVEASTFADDVRTAFRIRRSDIQVMKFHPEDFFLTLTNHSDREAILQEPRLMLRNGRVYRFRPWDERRGAECVDVRFRVRVYVEGIPMHARTDATAAKIIGKKSSIHYIEEYSRRRNYNRTFDYWVWSSDPSSIPRATRLTITSADEEGLPVDTPFPELEAVHPAPSDTKKVSPILFLFILTLCKTWCPDRSAASSGVME
uniref:Uncharacterized protein n=2 Tax=Oryza sativa subsp. japonica TaxID=39947 RepID=Q84TY2_ORYSJ|nr:hypothetical protein [Oryza sativa Japonica Group]